jgi:hypothetical protein
MNGPMTDLWRVLLILINGPIIFLSMLINGPMAGTANTNEWAHYIPVNNCEWAQDRPMASAADTNKWAHYISVNAYKRAHGRCC